MPIVSRLRLTFSRAHDALASATLMVWMITALLACGQGQSPPPEVDHGAASDRGMPSTGPSSIPSPDAGAREARSRDMEVGSAAAREGLFLGVVLARSEVDLGAEVPGPVREVLVRVGDRVDAGAVLARLDTRDLEHRLAIERSSLQASEADVRQRGLELRRAEQESKRRQALAELLSREEVDEAAFEQEAAEATLEAAEARQAEARARVRQLQEELRRSVLRAPFAGTVSARYLDPGALAAAGAPVLRLISTDGWLVRFAVPPGEIHEVRLGQKVTVRADGNEAGRTTAPLTATVRHIAPQLDLASQMIFVEAQLELPGQEAPAVPSGTPVWVSPVET